MNLKLHIQLNYWINDAFLIYLNLKLLNKGLVAQSYLEELYA